MSLLHCFWFSGGVGCRPRRVCGCSDRAAPRGGSTARPIPARAGAAPGGGGGSCSQTSVKLCVPGGSLGHPRAPCPCVRQSVCPRMLQRGDSCAGDSVRCLCPSALHCQYRPPPYGNVPRVMPRTGCHRRRVNTRGVCVCGCPRGGTQSSAAPLCSPARSAPLPSRDACAL